MASNDGEMEPEIVENELVDKDLEDAKDGEEEESPEQPEVDESVRVKGRVVSYFTRKGFGFINVLDEEDAEAESTKVFVHWKAITSSDRWPQLTPETEVEFFVGTQKDGRKYASNVTAVGGGELNNETEGEKLIENPIKGRVKFYDTKKGFGFVELLEDCTIEEEALAKGTDIHVGRESIVSSDPCPGLRAGMDVEFFICKSAKGLTCAEVSGAERAPISIPQEPRTSRPRRRRFRRGGEKNAGRGRQRGGRRHYDNYRHYGVLASWNGEKGFGWIELSNADGANGANGAEEKVFVHRNEIECGKVVEGAQVSFSLQRNRNRGPNAYRVHVLDENSLSDQTQPYGHYIPSVLSLLVDASQASKIQGGKKGQYIRQINRHSGTLVQVIELEEHFGPKRLLNVTGYSHGIKRACQMIFSKLYGNNSENEKTRLIFLFHDVQSMMGRLIGKKGSNINVLRRIPNLQATVQNSFALQGQPMSQLKLEGSFETVENGVPLAVDMLVKLYHDTIIEYFSGYQYYYNQVQGGQQQPPYNHY